MVASRQTTFIRVVRDYFSEDVTIKLKFGDQKRFSHARRAEMLGGQRRHSRSNVKKKKSLSFEQELFILR